MVEAVDTWLIDHPLGLQKLIAPGLVKAANKPPTLNQYSYIDEINIFSMRG